jgi:hypothetical protein
MGFKKTSDVIAVSFSLTELGANTFSQSEIALQLDVLNNEIAVILAVDLDVQTPDAVPSTNTATRASMSSTTRTAVGNLGATNTLAVAGDAIRAGGFVDSGVGFSRSANETYQANLDFIGLIATNNFFIQLIGENNVNPKSVSGRVWLQRAKADSTTYAALVQSEVLSS